MGALGALGSTVGRRGLPSPARVQAVVGQLQGGSTARRVAASAALAGAALPRRAPPRGPAAVAKAAAPRQGDTGDTGDTSAPDPLAEVEQAWLVAVDAAVIDSERDPEAALATLGSLWSGAPNEELAEEALQAIVLVGGASWDQGYRGRFLRRVAPGALRHGRAWEVLPSVAMAQAVLESGWGRSGLSTRHKNLFGIKAGASSKAVALPTREHQDGALRPTTRRFRTFESWEASLAYHARLLATDRRYAGARDVWTDPVAYTEAIASTYASHPDYARSLQSLVRRYGLDRFDALVVEASAADARRAAREAAVQAPSATPTAG